MPDPCMQHVTSFTGMHLNLHVLVIERAAEKL
jgi:hypothetical protein